MFLEISLCQLALSQLSPYSRKWFWGMAGFYLIWILNVHLLAKLLYQATKDSDWEQSEWMRECQIDLWVKKVLVQAPASGIPNVTKLLTLYVSENKGMAAGLLSQIFGSWEHPAT